MDLWWFVIAGGVAAWTYRRGKQFGSRFAYRIGRRRGRREGRRRR